MTLRTLFPALALLLASWPAPVPAGDDLDTLARQYLVLQLAMGEHDPAHVDAYFGPPELRAEAEAAELGLADIHERAAVLDAELAQRAPHAGDEWTALRIRSLRENLLALDTRIHMAEGKHFPFDEESQRLFGAIAPDYDAAQFQAVLDEIEALVPGEGSLEARVNAFRARFVVPVERLQAVFEAAIAECRRRTLPHLDLPEGESFRVEYVNDKPWSGYNWYQGGYHSLIQVNTDLPTYIDRAVDLGCHEGYPGHHVYNMLLERHLVNERGWAEFSLYPLFSPQSLIAEGSANYGIEMAFSRAERIAFEKETLFPLAGLDASRADDYYRLDTLIAKLSHAGNHAAREYLDGRMSAAQAQEWLMRYALSTEERAAQRLRFIDTYRSYVINYNLGRDLVQAWTEAGAAGPELRWQRFGKLLSMPLSAIDLGADGSTMD